MFQKTFVLLFTLCAALGFSTNRMNSPVPATEAPEIVQKSLPSVSAGNIDSSILTFTLSEVEFFLTDTDSKKCTFTIVNNSSDTYSIGFADSGNTVSVEGSESSGWLDYKFSKRQIMPGTNSFSGNVAANGTIKGVHFHRLYLLNSAEMPTGSEYWEADSKIDYAVKRPGVTIFVSLGVFLGLAVIVLIVIFAVRRRRAHA
jgi:hypothetical protein